MNAKIVQDMTSFMSGMRTPLFQSIEVDLLAVYDRATVDLICGLRSMTGQAEV
jgi:hypothetical protein